MEVSKKLIDDCSKNDRKAQFELYKLCYRELMNVCLRYKNEKSEAEELLNQGFLKILTNLDKYSVDVPFQAWSRRIVLNTIIDNFRKEKKINEVVEYADFQETNYEHHNIDLNEADKKFSAEELEAMMEKLPPVSKKVFNLYAIDGFSHKEIGDMLSISVGTSKWHVSFARTELKKLLDKKLNPTPVEIKQQA